MPFTAILAILTLLGLVVVFGVTYKRKGLKAAFIVNRNCALCFFDIIRSGNLRGGQHNALNFTPPPYPLRGELLASARYDNILVEIEQAARRTLSKHLSTYHS